jgi:Tol biopolymer transport system component
VKQTQVGRTALWVKQLPTGPMTAFATGSSLMTAGWSPDGASIVYCDTLGAGTAIFRQRADGLGGRTVLVRDPQYLFEGQLSPDGRWLIAVRSKDPSLPSEVVAMELGRDTVVRSLFPANQSVDNPALSPDGRWLAYDSRKSGRDEVYVQPFPDLDKGIWQVSIDGGVNPTWSPDGERLYFSQNPNNDIFEVDLATRPAFTAGLPRQAASPAARAGTVRPSGFAVGSDGRLLVVAGASAGGDLRLIRVEHLMAGPQWESR